MRRRIIISAAVSLILGLCITASLAYWNDEGNRLSFTDHEEREPRCVDAGGGNAIVAWIDKDINQTDEWIDGVRVQRIDRRGDTRWAFNGIKLNPGLECSVDEVEAVTDGRGGAIVAWVISYSHNPDIYIQRVTHEGDTVWTTSVSATSFSENNIRLCEDGTGGAFVTWFDDRTGSTELYAQRFDADGNNSFPYGGTEFPCTPGAKYQIAAAPAGAGELVVAWGDDRNGNRDIFAQGIDTTGAPLWTEEQPVCTDEAGVDDLMLVTDHMGGAVAAWIDYRNGSEDIYVQRLSPGNKMVWATDGVEVCTTAYSCYWLALTGDGDGGAIISWTDYRNGDFDLFAQKIGFRGDAMWTVNGVTVCEAAGNVQENTILKDTAGGAILTWVDQRTGEREIFTQHLDYDGYPVLAVDGVQISATGLNEIEMLRTVNDADMGVFAAWMNTAAPDSIDIYATCFYLDGTAVDPEPRILAAGDVPADEGGWVRLEVGASPYDDPEAFYDIVTGYNIWRRITASAFSAGQEATAAPDAPFTAEELGAMLTDPDLSKGMRLNADQAAAFELPPGEWESLGFNGAMLLGEYSFTVPTRTDSSSAGPATECYVVTAHTNNHLAVFVSDTVTAYSVDNLAPAAPLGICAEQSYAPAGLQLDWDDNGEDDLAGYRVYRGGGSGFIPSPANLEGEVTESGFFDGTWSWEEGYWYKIAAVDRHGNESVFAVLGPDMVTGGEPAPLPDATFLAQNFPNPFNPSTTIAFGLKSRGELSLRIYDAAGRLVRTLAGGTADAGRYELSWNGLDDSGTSVASGVYFYRLTFYGAAAERFEETRKMILLR